MAKDMGLYQIGPNIVELTVPLSGGTPAGTFLVEVEADAVVETPWPWPSNWVVTSE